ncbi:M50 family metallopeptidase [Bacillus sp. FJAT-44742]|uniref:M50 family metallopeptidase n=1 Tax=Bacillus sp. FJAT-44742 TaxID=2014005 RepID=UPI000C248964|nr:M50 family metallopeptidase [Bacillus sp. FJAT-44742]
MTEIIQFVLLVLVISFLTYLPIIGSYFSLFHTLIHENGHALAAKLTGGKVGTISLFHSTEGLITYHHHWAGKVITALAGYPFASAVSVLYIWAVRQEWHLEIGISLLLLLLFNLLFWVRNLYGWLWVLSTLVFTYFLWQQGYTTILEYIVTGIGLVLLTQALISSWHIFVVSIKASRYAGDASSLARYTFIPAPLWGLLFFFQGTIFFVAGSFVWLGKDFLFFLN